MNINLLNKIAETNSRKEKEKLLSSVDDYTKECIRLATDTYIRFNVKPKEKEMVNLWQGCHQIISSACSYADGALEKWLESYFFELCSQLSSREITGNSARSTLEAVLNLAPTEEEVKWACRILNKDLRAGVSEKTVLKVFPGLISPFTVALAEEFKPEKHKLEGEYFVDPKLDGLRMVVVDGVPYTRNGRVINSVENILDSIPNTILDNYVLDGECMDPNATFEETISKARTQSGSYDGLAYFVFDFVHKDDWFKRETKPLYHRLKQMEELLPESDFVNIVRPKKLVSPSMETLLGLRDEFIAQGYEGAMAKRADAQYPFKRSKDILKLKDFETEDVKIVEVAKGEEGKRHEGRLGALIAEAPDGTIYNIGTGYSDELRDQLWEQRDSLIGKTVEVKFQNKTSKGSSRFPTFLRFRPDKD